MTISITIATTTAGGFVKAVFDGDLDLDWKNTGKFFFRAAYLVWSKVAPESARPPNGIENVEERRGIMETVNYKYLNYACLILIAAAAFFVLDVPF
ncbi:hypothetical protein KKD52_08075 [Myxococcota bacterium]|nr:hypothetical protein [Myxococcota bacterium]